MTTVLLVNRVGEPGVDAAVGAARRGKRALDIVEAGIRVVEADSTVRSVGVGGWTNLLGEVELDASIMDGRTLRCGGVGAMKGFAHPITVARQVMERLPHVLLVGEGAGRFAAECGIEPAETLTDEAKEQWSRWLKRHVSPELRDRWPDVALARWSRRTADPETARGTTCYLVKDSRGDFAVGVSTCGWAFKYPGRIGDSPIVGAGCYADNRYGAAACTGQGELAIRATTARSTVLYMKMGMTVEEACRESLQDLRGLERDYRGGLVIHAVSQAGRHSVRSIGIDRQIAYYAWRTDASGAGEPKRLLAVREDW